MYGLPHAGILANKLLKEKLLQNDYFEVPHTPGLFRHKARPVWFTLVVDDFGIKYVGKEHAQHLLGVLKEFYEIEEDWTGSLYCGITLDWHYDQQYVDISMVNYVLKQLAKYKQPPPKNPQHYSFELKPIQYGKQSDTIPHEEPSPLLDKDEKKHIQQVVGSSLYYARAIDMIILLALSDIASEEANPSEKTMKRVC